MKARPTSCARKHAFANTICKGPPGLKLAVLATSMIKVGRSSCSKSSIMPTLPSICNPDCLFLESGLLGILDLSKELQLPGVLVERGGLALLMLPLASFNVVIPPASSRALFNIAAAASGLENLGRIPGRCLAVWEKNNGEGGDPRFAEKPLGNVSGSRV